jgi:hypothetical protein
MVFRLADCKAGRDFLADFFRPAVVFAFIAPLFVDFEDRSRPSGHCLDLLCCVEDKRLPCACAQAHRSGRWVPPLPPSGGLAVWGMA